MSKEPRYVFVDALRGIAAVGVLLHHLFYGHVLEPALRTVFPAVAVWLCGVGVYGVQIFFVISGFVIAHSLRKFQATRQEIGLFIVRRQLRLDPPYWATVVLALAALAAERLTPGLHGDSLPGPAAVAANLFYLHNLLHVPPIVGVSWTLCIEIQFYLFFILLLAAARAMGSGRGGGSQQLTAAPNLVLVTAVGSLVLAHLLPETAWFASFWFYFAAGALCYWVIRGRYSRVALLGLVAMMYGAAILASWPGQIVVGASTVLLLWVLGERGRLQTWLGQGVVQYFGRISYSLYLVHFIVASSILKVGYKLTHDNGWAAVGWFVLGGAVSVGVAHLMYAFVERPSMRLAGAAKNWRAASPEMSSATAPQQGTAITAPVVEPVA